MVSLACRRASKRAGTLASTLALASVRPACKHVALASAAVALTSVRTLLQAHALARERVGTRALALGARVYKHTRVLLFVAALSFVAAGFCFG